MDTKKEVAKEFWYQVDKPKNVLFLIYLFN